MKKLRIAVVGLGRIGWKYHIPKLVEHDGFDLVAAVDPMIERVNELQEKYSIKGYVDYDEMLNNEELDLVTIASPTPFHYEQALIAFNHGIDVFMEKPFAVNLGEADAIIEKMKSSNRKLMVYQPHRVTSECQALKSIIKSGIAGNIYMIKRSFSSYIRRNDWQSQKKYGGGMLNNYGAHYIDQLLYLAGYPAGKAACRMRCIASLGDGDDVVKAVIESENGIILDLDINTATAFQLPAWTILGSKGTVVLEDTDKTGPVFHIRYLDESNLKELELQKSLAASDRSYNSDTLRWIDKYVPVSDFSPINFYDMCYEYFALDKEPFVPVTETREVMRIIEECRKDAGW